jgi:dTDP-glucose 4,6-dehydratase
VRPTLYAQGVIVRDWIHVADHLVDVLAIRDRGRSGQTYLIGADGERDNLGVVRTLLELMGRPTDWYELVGDRPGHDLRYAIDSSRLRAETGWRPRYTDLRDGLAQTIAWYTEHEDWWQADKTLAEERYARLGR